MSDLSTTYDSRENLRGKAAEGCIRPTISQFFQRTERGTSINCTVISAGIRR